METNTIKQAEQVYDVVVVGGGMAGITATIAAARHGAKTLLIEKAGWLGGMGITGATGLHTFYNIFGAFPGAERMRVVAGLPQELIDRVQGMGGCVGHIRMERGADFVSMLTVVEPEIFKVVAAKMCLEAGATLLLHTVMDELRAVNGHVESITVWNKAGRTSIRASQFIDCSGDGDLAAYAGAPYQTFSPGDHGAYHAGFTFRLVNVDLARLEADLEARGVIIQIAHAVKPGMTQPEIIRLGLNMRPFHEQGIKNAPGGFLSTSIRPREITFCNCINFGPNNGLDPAALTNAEVYLREQMLGVAQFFRENVAGCEDCYPAGAAPSAGQRRGRAIHCQYELTKEDCVDARSFDDQVGCFSFIDNPVDKVKDAGAYGIPYRALIPVGLDNVLVAGRMVSVDLSAHNSTRNTVCCMICGQAAGTAAALAVKGKTDPSSVDRLQNQLVQDGVILHPRPEPL